jgi:hypothetical protein
MPCYSESAMHSADIGESLGHLFQGSEIESRHADGGGKSGGTDIEGARPRGAPRLETSPRHHCNNCHKENARPVRSEPQESHAAPWRLQSVANRPAGIRAAKGFPPNSTARHVQDSAENEQRAKPDQEHSPLNSSLPRTTEPGFKPTAAESFRRPEHRRRQGS